MKLTQIRVAGHGAWPHLSLPALKSDLNVVFGAPRSGKSTVANLAAHVLYGKTESTWRREFAQSTPLAEGSIDVESPQGRFVLRRHRDGSPTGRLTVAAAGGGAVDGRTIRTLLGGLAPALLAELYAVDFAVGPRAAHLLEGEFARQFTLALATDDTDDSSPLVCREHAATSGTATVDRRRLDELVARRDDVVRQIETHMSSRRRDSAVVEQEIAQVDAQLAKRRALAEDAAVRLHAVDAKLAEVAAQLRYYSLETTVRPWDAAETSARREAIDAIDQEISGFRQMLADLQLRDAAVRRELAEVHPDGTADSVGALAQQRATLGILEQLVDDLDAEVAGLARSHEPGRCIAIDAHGRMTPVAQMLRQQLYALCGQMTEQERALRRSQLRAELRQLARAQTDLSEQLEYVLERRQELIHESQLEDRVATPPQAPVHGHCRCERHHDFLHNADEALLSRAGRGRHEADAKRRRGELETQRDELRRTADDLAREIAELASRWDRLQQERLQRDGRSSLDELRAELDHLELEIQRVLNAPATFASTAHDAGHRRVWKASDALAQLTDGQLTQIRISREGRATTIVDRTGRLLTLDDLTPQQNDQAYLALVLALASSLSARGVDLPVVLDEPFLRQDAPAAAAMAGVLAEYAREGRQALLFTEDREALKRFQSLGVDVRDIDALRRGTSPEPPRTAPMPTAAPAAQTRIRVVRETLDGSAPRRRGGNDRPVPPADTPVHFLTADASMADFPVLGNDTAMVFSSLGIRTVEDLLAADAAEVARRLAHPAVAADAVRLWQQHMSLMCFVPGVSLADAQVLAACDVSSPEALYSIDVRLLAETIARFLTSERGRRFASTGNRFSRERLASLQKHARRQRDRWQLLSPRYAWVERTAEAPRKRSAAVAKSQPTARRTPSRRDAVPAKPRIARATKPRPLRFLLSRTSTVVDAPSIGAVMAARLAKVGIRSVADLLNANPDSTAHELGASGVTAATIARWQSQARLVCRVPELRGAGAKILVACGLTEPEQIARSTVAELSAKVQAVCRTAEGQRILRGGEVPSPARIAAWIRHAAHMRPLEAA